jgi:hypothetical protein
MTPPHSQLVDNSAQIAQIQAILQAGADSVDVDGQRVHYDISLLRKQLRELMDHDKANRGRRPRVAAVSLGRTASFSLGGY